MKNLLFEFSVNRENETIEVKREFAANLDLVWDAWTKSEILDKWWAPKPWHVETKSMDFSEGGRWFYAMVSPEGEKHWCTVDYETIDPKKYFTALDAFSDENGNKNTEMPHMHWNISFGEDTESTVVNIRIKLDSIEEVDKIINMGFKEGFTMGLGNLDELLVELKK